MGVYIMAKKVSVDSKERAKLKDILEKASVNHLQRKLDKVSKNSTLEKSLGTILVSDD